DYPLVHIIVLTYRMREVVRICIQSLLRLEYPNYRLVIVDNGSADGTEEMLRDQFPGLTLIQTGGNLGYTGGNNRGIEYAIENGADYVLLINPDTVLANPQFLAEMIEHTEAHPETGIAGPRVFLRDHDRVQNTVLFPPGLWRNSINWIRYRIKPASLALSRNEPLETKVLNGVCLLIRTSCLRQIGLFDENIFMYIEDADLDYRAQRQGWQVKYLPIDSVIHKQKQDGYHMTGQVSFFLKRNSVYYLHKIGRRTDAWGYAVLSLLLLALRAILTFKKDGFIEYISFSARLAGAYKQILLNRQYDESFGPPYAKS
ncbi:MAG: glycosyltransferase family 2 protein, partial [Blastocatellia bacterium]|nr:glycosyltransferase family 2 protein [Blastocatellia bacterium]